MTILPGRKQVLALPFLISKIDPRLMGR